MKYLGNYFIEKIYKFAFSLFLSLAFNVSYSQTTISGLFYSRFDTVVDNKHIALYSLRNDNGIELCITNYGARIVSLMVPDRTGKLRDVELGFDNIKDYLSYKIPFGATIGRCANRIRDGKFKLCGKEYQLQINDNCHTTHGGSDGWSGKIFDVKRLSKNSILLSYISKDCESGFPGTVDAEVKYVLENDNSVNISYTATADKPTIINMTNHSYFCLSGDPSHDMMNSLISFNADFYAPKANDNVPDGTLRSVVGTPFDFRQLVNMGEILKKYPDFDEIKKSDGYGVSILFNNHRKSLPDISVINLESGIQMDVFTTQPNVQFFSTNSYGDKNYVGKKCIKYVPRNAICLETQMLPNSINVADWDSPILMPGKVYHQNSKYRFLVNKNY